MTFTTFVGLDLHKRYLTACALAADGTLLGEVRRMPVTMDALLDFLTALPAPATIAVEATLSCQQARHPSAAEAAAALSLTA